MGQSIRSMTILFDKDVTEEYIDYIEKTAICYKNVQRVERDVAGNFSEWAIESRLNDAWISKLRKVMYGD